MNTNLVVEGVDYGRGQAAVLRRACHKRVLIHESEPDGIPTSNRFVYYELGVR